jgi:hypothetical protein
VSVDFYQHKLALVKKLSELTDAMLECTSDQLVSDDNAHERFLSLLEERETIMEQIDALNATLSVQDSNMPDESAAVLQENLQAEIIRIQGQNEILEEIVRGSLGQIKEEAKKVQEGKQSNRAYIGRVPSAEGSFIDKRR